MDALGPYISSIGVIAALALVWGGMILIRRGPDRRKGVLMLVMAAVLIGNVLIWSWPMPVRG